MVNFETQIVKILQRNPRIFVQIFAFIIIIFKKGKNACIVLKIVINYPKKALKLSTFYVERVKKIKNRNANVEFLANTRFTQTNDNPWDFWNFNEYQSRLLFFFSLFRRTGWRKCSYGWLYLMMCVFEIRIGIFFEVWWKKCVEMTTISLA